MVDASGEVIGGLIAAGIAGGRAVVAAARAGDPATILGGMPRFTPHAVRRTAAAP